MVQFSRHVLWSLENARSSGEWIGPVQYCKLIEDRRSSTDPVLTFECCLYNFKYVRVQAALPTVAPFNNTLTF